MKVRLRVVIALILTLVLQSIAQVETSCPVISVNGPEGIVPAGMPASFAARVSGVSGNLKLTYDWSVSHGVIKSGQGTLQLEIIQPPDQCPTVTLKVGGLPDSCPNMFSEQSCGDPAPAPIKLDEIVGPLTKRNDKQIKRIVEAALNAPTDQLYIIISGKYARRRREQVLTKLNILFRDERARVTFVDSPSKVDKIVIWSVPPGATPPTPEIQRSERKPPQIHL